MGARPLDAPRAGGSHPLPAAAAPRCWPEHADRQGADARGYMAWSLFDNLEWSFGFSKRFGLYHVDFKTLERTLKRSGQYYARVVSTHGASLTE